MPRCASTSATEVLLGKLLQCNRAFLIAHGQDGSTRDWIAVRILDCAREEGEPAGLHHRDTQVLVERFAWAPPC